jgi:hypothetical protein
MKFEANIVKVFVGLIIYYYRGKTRFLLIFHNQLLNYLFLT